MKNLINIKWIVLLLLLVLSAKTSKAQDYPKNYFGIFFASGEYELQDNSYSYFGNEYYFRPGISYARRFSKHLYVGIRTHKLVENYRFSEVFMKINLLTRYRVQPHLGITIGKITDNGLRPDVSFGFDFHVGSKMVINTFMVGSLTDYVYHFGIGTSYKF